MDIYKIGVEIALTNSISGALTSLSGHFLGVERDAKRLENMFGPNSAMIVGITAAGAGMLLISGKLLSNGAELEKQVGQMKFMLDNYKELAKDIKTAITISVNTPGSTVADNIRAMKEILPSVKNEAEARKAITIMMPEAIAVSRMTNEPVDDIIRMIIKAEDIVGHVSNPKTHEFDPERLKVGFHAALSTLIAAGGNLHANDLLRYAQMNATFARLFTDPLEMWKSAYTPMLEMGGAKAGTATTAMGQQMVAGRMSVAAAKRAIELHLLDASKTHFTGTGVVIDDGGWKGEEALREGDFAKWFREVFKPAVQAQHHGPLTSYDYVKELSRFTSRQNAARLGSIFLGNEAQVTRDKAMVETVSKKNFYDDVMSSDLGANVNAFQTSITSILQVVGGPMVKPAIAGMHALTGALTSFLESVSKMTDGQKRELTVGMAGGGLAALIYGGSKAARAIKSIVKGSGSSGALLASAAALDASAALLSEAAIALGAKGGGGLGPLELTKDGNTKASPKANNPMAKPKASPINLPKAGAGILGTLLSFLKTSIGPAMLGGSAALSIASNPDAHILSPEETKLWQKFGEAWGGNNSGPHPRNEVHVPAAPTNLIDARGFDLFLDGNASKTYSGPHDQHLEHQALTNLTDEAKRNEESVSKWMYDIAPRMSLFEHKDTSQTYSGPHDRHMEHEAIVNLTDITTKGFDAVVNAILFPPIPSGLSGPRSRGAFLHGIDYMNKNGLPESGGGGGGGFDSFGDSQTSGTGGGSYFGDIGGGGRAGGGKKGGQHDLNWFNTHGLPGSKGGSSTPASKKATGTTIGDILMKDIPGLTKAQAAGIVGNFNVESIGFQPTIKGDSGLAMGLAQWHADRFNPNAAWAKQNGYDPYSVVGQAHMAAHELLTTENGALQKIMRAQNPAAAAYATGAFYERPLRLSDSLRQRAAGAEDYMKYSGDKQQTITNNIHLDGKQIATHITKHLTKNHATNAPVGHHPSVDGASSAMWT